MFSATVRLGRRLTSWYTVLMPAACAAAGLANSCTVPSTVTVPLSIGWTPVSALINVDFPAPFSPISEWTSPG